MEEWDALPWWVAQMYWDGLEREFGGDSPSRQEQEEEFDQDSSAGRLASMGVQVRQKQGFIAEAGT